MSTFMMVCTFKEGTAMDEVFAVVAEEQAQVKALKEAGRLGSVQLALARGTVFLEIFADDAAGAEATVHTLPMAAWWDLDAFAVGAP